MSETQAVFAEGAILTLKNILYRYLEGSGHKHFHKLSQFVTTMQSTRNKLGSGESQQLRFFAISRQQENTRNYKT